MATSTRPPWPRMSAPTPPAGLALRAALAQTAEGTYRFELGPLALEVDATCGGRVTRFALDGDNVLTGRDAHADNFGSTFWTSPQSAWGWPPPPEIDCEPFDVRQEGLVLTLQGPPCAALGVAITKTVSIDDEREAIIFEYGIRNVGHEPVRAAGWEVSRVATGGLTFFPTGRTADCPPGITPLRTRELAGMTWFRYDASQVTGDQKSFADGTRGWLAHVTGDLVFVKSFNDVTPEEQAPGEAEIELFADGGRRYVEVELQGPYTEIAPDRVARWRVAWQLRRLPPELCGSTEGSSDLVAFVERIVR